MKPVYLIAQLLLLTVLAYQVTGLTYRQLFSPVNTGFEGPKIRSGEPAGPAMSIPAVPPRNYAVILEKNLFQVLTRDSNMGSKPPADELIEQPLEKTRLQLALWGTVTAASDKNAFAVIENKKTREQSLFQVGDTVEGGVIQKSHATRLFACQRQNQLLEVDITQKPSVMASSPLPLPEPETGFPDPETAFQQAKASGLPSLMKQARIRPFFSDGKPDGLLLYGIRNDSTFQQIGLRNGDIIKSINGSDILSAQDAVTLYQSLNTALDEMPDIRFTIQRRGKIQEIVYNAQNNEYTVENVSDE